MTEASQLVLLQSIISVVYEFHLLLQVSMLGHISVADALQFVL